MVDSAKLGQQLLGPSLSGGSDLSGTMEGMHSHSAGSNPDSVHPLLQTLDLASSCKTSGTALLAWSTLNVCFSTWKRCASNLTRLWLLRCYPDLAGVGRLELSPGLSTTARNQRLGVEIGAMDLIPYSAASNCCTFMCSIASVVFQHPPVRMLSQHALQALWGESVSISRLWERGVVASCSTWEGWVTTTLSPVRLSEKGVSKNRNPLLPLLGALTSADSCNEVGLAAQLEVPLIASQLCFMDTCSPEPFLSNL